MKVIARSSIALPAEDVALIERLKRRVGAKTNVAVVHRALRLLESTTERDELRWTCRDPSNATRESLVDEMADLDEVFPPHDPGPSPPELSLRREDLYDDRGR